MTATDDVLRVLVDHVHVGGDVAAADTIAEWRDNYDKQNAPDDSDDEDGPDTPDRTPDQTTRTGPTGATRTTPTTSAKK